MGANIQIASGRATCRVCGEKIKQGQLTVVVTGYRFENHIHSNPNECKGRNKKALKKPNYKMVI